MSIEQSLERIENALEKIANPIITVQAVAPVVDKTPGADAAAALNPPAKDLSERDAVKKKLDELGVKYNAKMSTKGLQALLPASNTAQESTPAPAIVQTSFLEDPAPAKATNTFTLEQAREHLKRFAAKFGSDKAIKILNGFGCKDITAVAAANKLPEFVAEVLKQEAEHGRK